jgi:mRNA interferase HicA
MKQRDLKKALEALGWKFLREGGSHEVWTNGVETEAIPRHREVNEYTAKAIIRRAKLAGGMK